MSEAVCIFESAKVDNSGAGGTARRVRKTFGKHPTRRDSLLRRLRRLQLSVAKMKREMAVQAGQRIERKINNIWLVRAASGSALTL